MILLRIWRILGALSLLRPRYAFFSLLAVSVLVSGCGPVQSAQNAFSFSLGKQPVLYVDQWARKSSPLVYVHPAEKLDYKPTALFMPFRVTQPISEPEILGYSQARVIWQTWLSKGLFSIMEFDGDHGPFRRDRAVALARAKGADLVIGGFVTYYFAGGSEADSQVALQLEIYDVPSGQLVWSIGQSALMPAREVNDYIVFATQTRLPSDPMYALAKAIGDDMARQLQLWLPAGEDQKTGSFFEALRDLGKRPPAPVKPAF